MDVTPERAETVAERVESVAHSMRAYSTSHLIKIYDELVDAANRGAGWLFDGVLPPALRTIFAERDVQLCSECAVPMPDGLHFTGCKGENCV